MSRPPHIEFEYAWADFCGSAPHKVVGCSSGTAALHLALECLTAGSTFPTGRRACEVLVPDYTMAAVPRAVVLAGMTPVFVDCGPDGNLRPDLVERAVGPHTVGVIAVHVYGRRAAMADIARVADLKHLFLVEDSAEAHGIAPHPRTNATCWSFYKNKVVAGEEGGAVLFRSGDHAYLAESLRCLGFTEAHDYTHRPRGHNYRLSDAHAAMILDGPNAIGKYETNLALRREQEDGYVSALTVDRPDRFVRPQVSWALDVKFPGMSADAQHRTVRSLQEAGLAARFGFKSLTRYQGPGGEFAGHRLVWDGVGEPASVVRSREVVSLPLGHGLPAWYAGTAARVIAAALRG
ncbi:MAG: DegT/DnrJ/EryC1/StrS family aminotransferase [Fimbriiglobus sp.]